MNEKLVLFVMSKGYARVAAESIVADYPDAVKADFEASDIDPTVEKKNMTCSDCGEIYNQQLNRCPKCQRFTGR